MNNMNKQSLSNYFSRIIFIVNTENATDRPKIRNIRFARGFPRCSWIRINIFYLEFDASIVRNRKRVCNRSAAPVKLPNLKTSVDSLTILLDQIILNTCLSFPLFRKSISSKTSDLFFSCDNPFLSTKHFRRAILTRSTY